MSVDQNNWSTKRPLTLGFIALAMLVLGIGAWSVKTNIAGAIVSPGIIEVESNRQIVQHPDGGVIEEILVNDGDVVEVDDILLRFDDRFLQSDLIVITEQFFEIMARKARLEAERDGAAVIKFGTALLNAGDDLVVAEIMAGQDSLFMARRDTLAREEALLGEQKAQISKQITGAEAQSLALNRQQFLIAEELADETLLFDKGLSEVSKVRDLMREAARMEGALGSLNGNIAASRGKIAEIEIQILSLSSRLREEAIATLRDLQYREIELRETQASLLETLQRLDVRAPSSGIVFGAQFHAPRSVVRPAETILFIVPQDSPLIITTKIPAIHIDQVYVGQATSLHFSAFDLRTTPVIMGRVIKISPDVFVDDATGESYYAAEIRPNSEELIKLDGLEVLPGMPVEAFLKTTDRTPLEYLLKPLTDYFDKAFRSD